MRPKFTPNANPNSNPKTTSLNLTVHIPPRGFHLQILPFATTRTGRKTGSRKGPLYRRICSFREINGPKLFPLVTGQIWMPLRGGVALLSILASGGVSKPSSRILPSFLWSVFLFSGSEDFVLRRPRFRSPAAENRFLFFHAQSPDSGRNPTWIRRIPSDLTESPFLHGVGPSRQPK